MIAVNAAVGQAVIMVMDVVRDVAPQSVPPAIIIPKKAEAEQRCQRRQSTDRQH